jgi:hypothetical protein
MTRAYVFSKILLIGSRAFQLNVRHTSQGINMSDNNTLKGLSGWLILVGIGLIIAPLRISFTYGPMFYSIFTDGSFEMLTNPGSEQYHSLWGPLLIFEVIYNSSIVAVSVFLIYLFLTKNYLFPKVYIAMVLSSLFFIPLDAWLGSFVITNEPMFDPDTTKEFARALVSTVVWVPYMLISKRVKATFVEKYA